MLSAIENSVDDAVTSVVAVVVVFLVNVVEPAVMTDRSTPSSLNVFDELLIPLSNILAP